MYQNRIKGQIYPQCSFGVDDFGNQWPALDLPNTYGATRPIRMAIRFVLDGQIDGIVDGIITGDLNESILVAFRLV